MSKNIKGAILLVAFSRPKLLPQVLDSIRRANSPELPLIVIFQKGNLEVQNILQTALKSQDYFLQVSGDNRSTTNNISFNRFLGYDFAFKFLECDFVLAFEDDVLVSSDIFEFSDFVFKKYFNLKRFRGINFGSHEEFSDETNGLYSFQRFGIHGPASGITAATWNHFKKRQVLEMAKDNLFDGILEPYVRSGFMVTPTNSRFLDIGVGGTHTSQNSNDPYFDKMKQSFVGDTPVQKDFRIHTTTHTWRNDVFPYLSRDNLLFDFLKFFGERRANPLFRKLERAIYKVFILPRVRHH